MKLQYSQMIALAAAGLFAAASASVATPSGSDEVKVRIEYHDLDIQHPAGAKTLYERMQYASARACDVKSYLEAGSLQRVRHAQSCYDDLLDGLVARIDSNALQALHRT